MLLQGEQENSNALTSGALYLKVFTLVGNQAGSGDLGRSAMRLHGSEVFVPRVTDLARPAGHSYRTGC